MRTLRLIRIWCLFLASVLAVNPSASAGMIEPSVCTSETSPLSRLASETIARANISPKMSSGERCVVYQRQFMAAVKLREAAVRCGDGNDRDHIVARLDGAIEAMNSGIAENCGLQYGPSVERALRHRVCRSGSKGKGRPGVEELEIIRLNIERYRRLLQTDLNEGTRRAIQAMLAEFERKLVPRKTQIHKAEHRTSQ